MKDKVLILHLAHWDQLLGGAEQQLKYLSDFLINEKYEVHFLFLNRNEEQIQDSCLINHSIKHKKFFGFLGKYWFVYKNQIRKKIKAIKPKILITRTYSSWSGIVAQIALRENIKHLHFIASDNDVVKSSISIKFFRFFDKIELHYAYKVFNKHTQIICQNNFQKFEIKKRFDIEVELLKQAAPENDPLLIRKSKDRIRIVWVANFKPLKRPEKFLELVEYFREDDRVEFLMIGECKNQSYRNKLNEFSKFQTFIYTGGLPNEEVNKVLDSAHILINTSDYEGFSNTFVQAWLREVVVISLNSNPDDVLTKKNIGYKTNTIVNTIEVILELVAEPKIIRDKGRNSRIYALKNHSLKNNLKNNVFEE